MSKILVAEVSEVAIARVVGVYHDLAASNTDKKTLKLILLRSSSIVLPTIIGTTLGYVPCLTHPYVIPKQQNRQLKS